MIHFIKNKNYSLVNINTGESKSYKLIDIKEDSNSLSRKKVLYLRRNKAVLTSNFKKDLIVDGYAAMCTNEDQQSYTIEDDENGEIIKITVKNTSIIYDKKYENHIIIPGNREYKSLHEYI